MYHLPVLLHPSVDALDIKAGGVYVDVTFGGGGHSREILKRLDGKGKLYGFDQDVDAHANVPKEFDNFFLVPHNFRYLKKMLRVEGVKQVDGILADLGVSSHQFDEGERGFSFRADAPLDMRMDTEHGGQDARDIINTYSAERLQNILSEFGEVRNARTLAQAIVAERNKQAINTTGDLLRLAENYAMVPNKNRYYAQIFQALRMEVNEEMTALKEMLAQSAEILKPGGRLVVISYHSLEDRLAKLFIKKGNFDGADDSDMFGNVNRPLKAVNNKPIEPDATEIKLNPRARSAKMRVAVKS